MSNRLPVLLAVALSICSAPLCAQSSPAASLPRSAPASRTQIAGIVFDSLNARYLAHAEVIVEGSNRSVLTDSLGRFVVDTLPPGIYQVGVFHPILDTLGISLATQPFRLGPDSATTIVLAVPSARTLARDACGRRERGNESAIVGRVVDPETLQRVQRAEVSVAWREIQTSQSPGLVETPRIVRDTTDSLGEFKLCGLPSSLNASLQARRGATFTGEIPVTLGDRPVELVVRTVMLSVSGDVATTGSAKVSGTVVLEGNEPKAGTRVELAGTDVVSITNDRGDFAMTGLPSGSRVLVVRRLGFAEALVPVDLSSRTARRVMIALPRLVARMDPVLIQARRNAELDKIGFNQRRKTGFGYYITPDQLDKVRPTFVTDILKTVPGMRVLPGLHGDVVFSARTLGAGCMQYYLDDIPYQEIHPGDINTLVAANEVRAVEVYQETMVPPDYVKGGTSCTTVLLWTKFKLRN
ncbi:MAG TPA: carboxypeptidase-like regulatory domain-containing protein [Gemmatimonadaceae bacterium]|nr:carboxypeptidase-like regulatory domain-containing protein [Gemmatimonadaceae bacterium]